MLFDASKIAAAQHTWDSVLGVQTTLDCSVPPCILIVPANPSRGTLRQEFDLVRALATTGHWQDPIPPMAAYPDRTYVALADIESIGTEERTALFDRFDTLEAVYVSTDTGP